MGTGITLNSGNLGVSGISTFTGGLRASEGGDLVRLRVSGIATFNHIYADGLTVVGISTFTTVKVGTAATIDSSGINVTGVITTSQLSGGCLATIANMSGIHTLGVTTAASTSITLRHPNQTSNISNGDFVVGTGITVGTTVSAGAGTSSLTLSLPVGINSNANPLAFYKHDKIVTPAIIGGQLCRVWVNFNGTGTVFIRSSYNVSSITDNGEGDYTVNFTTALPDDKYSANVTGTRHTSGVDDFDFRATLAGTNFILAGSVRVIFANTTGSGADSDAPAMCVTIFR